jgi:hypothetical protein
VEWPLQVIEYAQPVKPGIAVGDTPVFEVRTMPVEHIGEFGTPGASREWLSAQADLAIAHIIKVCGEPPEEMELEVQWQDHELGSYPLIVLLWEDAMRGAPWEYIERASQALADFDEARASKPGAVLQIPEIVFNPPKYALRWFKLLRESSKMSDGMKTIVRVAIRLEWLARLSFLIAVMLLILLAMFFLIIKGTNQ